MMTDDALIARLRESLDELTTPSPTTQPLDIPDLDTVVVPLTDLRPSNRRWVATAGLVGVAAATLAAVVITRAPTDRGESAGRAPVLTAAASTVANDVDGGIPRFSLDLPGATIARGPDLQKSGSATGWHRQVFISADQTDDRVLIVSRYTDVIPFEADSIADFMDSSLDQPDVGLRELHTVRAADGPQIAEFISADDVRPAMWMQARGFTDAELSGLLNGGLIAVDDQTVAIAAPALRLVDAGPSAYGNGELWWSRAADYTLADGSLINVSVSTGTVADRFNDALPFDSELLNPDGRDVYSWATKLLDNSGQRIDQWGNTDATEDLHGVEWHDDTHNVNVRVTGNVTEAVLLEVAAALRLTPVK